MSLSGKDYSKRNHREEDGVEGQEKKVTGESSPGFLVCVVSFEILKIKSSNINVKQSCLNEPGFCKERFSNDILQIPAQKLLVSS